MASNGGGHSTAGCIYTPVCVYSKSTDRAGQLLSSMTLVSADIWGKLPPSARLSSRRQIVDIFGGRVIPRLAGPLQWRPAHHQFMPRPFRAMVFAFVACNKFGHMPYLPTEMIWEILSHFWWRGTCRELLRGLIR
jgi:hypothetical protein